MREKITIPEQGELEVWDRPRTDLPPEQYKPYDTSKGIIPPIADFGTGYRWHVTGLNHDETGFPTNKPSLVQPEEERLLAKITENLAIIEKYEYTPRDGARVGVVAYGSSARSAKSAILQALEQGTPVDFLRPVTLWPFPEKTVTEMADRVEVIIVPELNMGQMIHEVRRCIEGRARVVGVNRADGEPIIPEQILDRIMEVV
jgi:2-oxoglutarate ferredoxin oxidoreductase subunit alpha